MKRLSLTAVIAASLLAGSETKTQASTAPPSTTTEEHSVWVEPPTGSHIGGGFVRIPGTSLRSGEPGLQAAMESLDADGANGKRRVFALQAVVKVSEASEQKILAQWKQTNLHLGELLTLYLLARNDDNKVRQLAAAHAGGKTWKQLAGNSDADINILAKRVEQASSLSVDFYAQNTSNSTLLDASLKRNFIPRTTDTVVGVKPIAP